MGNTTKALTKGYAIASAALAAFLLFSAYLDKIEVKYEMLTGARRSVPRPIPGRPAEAEVFIGGFLGATLVFFFCALTIRAVGKAAGDIIEEVRRQFREKPGIMLGTVQAGLRPLRGHHHQGRPPRDGRAGHPGAWRSRSSSGWSSRPRRWPRS